MNVYFSMCGCFCFVDFMFFYNVICSVSMLPGGCPFIGVWLRYHFPMTPRLSTNCSMTIKLAWNDWWRTLCSSWVLTISFSSPAFPMSTVTPDNWDEPQVSPFINGNHHLSHPVHRQNVQAILPRLVPETSLHGPEPSASQDESHPPAGDQLAALLFSWVSKTFVHISDHATKT